MEERKQERPTMPVPFDIESLISELPKTSDKSKWTKNEYCTVELLYTVYTGIEYNEYGTDEDWARVSPYFPGGEFKA